MTRKNIGSFVCALKAGPYLQQVTKSGQVTERYNNSLSVDTPPPLNEVDMKAFNKPSACSGETSPNVKL